MKIKFAERMAERINNAKDDEARKITKVLFRYITRCGQSGDVSTLNALMGKIQGSASPWLISELLRGSLRFFYHLDNWIGLRDRFIEHAHKCGDDPSSLLVGLMYMDGYIPATEFDAFFGIHQNFKEQNANKVQVPQR